MVDNVKITPKFDGLNSPSWKVKMIFFLQSLGSWVSKTITKLFVVPNSDKDTWANITIKEFEANAKAHYALL